MSDERAPGGCIYRVDPDGKRWELVSMGYRNPFDMAFNRHGDLFTYDSDMEWDVNTPWYRPTRVCQADSGSDFGYRNGSGKWPTYYPDSLPPIVDIGPGSPTGITFGYGAKFPAKYQEALFICDWSYGKLYAVHLTPEAAATTPAELEEFITGTPLPLTDVVVNPKDGAMYFAIGGRKTLSGLYRVTYAGDESTAPSHRPRVAGAEARDPATARSKPSTATPTPKAVDAAWPHLGHADRFIRYAARVAVEFQDPTTWQERALAETRPAGRADRAPGPRPRRGQVAPAEAARRPRPARLGAARPVAEARSCCASRIGPHPHGPHGRRLDGGSPRGSTPLYPAKVRELNAELCKMLVALEAPASRRRRWRCWRRRPTQEEQIEYATALRLPQDRLDARASQGVFLVVPRGGPLQGRGEPRRVPQAHQGRGRWPRLLAEEKARR